MEYLHDQFIYCDNLIVSLINKENYYKYLWNVITSKIAPWIDRLMRK